MTTHSLMTARELRDRYMSCLALSLTIEKWDRARLPSNWTALQKSVYDTLFDEECLGASTCGLCMRYNTHPNYGCAGCPLICAGKQYGCQTENSIYQRIFHAICCGDRREFMRVSYELLRRLKRARAASAPVEF